MNIFTEQASLFGDIPVDRLADAYVEFFSQAWEIRSKLGQKTYLLDNYLSRLFRGISETYGNDISEKGLDPDYSLYAICQDAARPTHEQNHPLFKDCYDFIQSYPLDFQDTHTKNNVYMTLLSNSFMKTSLDEYRKELFRDLLDRFDPLELNDLYTSICELLGDENPMEQLNLLFQECFMMVSAITIYFKTLLNKLLDALTDRDDESSLQIFQLLLKHRLFEQIL